VAGVSTISFKKMLFLQLVSEALNTY